MFSLCCCPVSSSTKHYILLQGEGLRTIELSMEDLQTKFKKHVIPSTIQCAGNRRSEMKSVKPVKGLDWNVGAIGTAVWGGVLLKV